LGGGALLDLGIYPISFSFDMLGRPRTVFGTASFKDTGADAQIATLFGYDSPARAYTVSASNAQGPNTAAVVGSEGRIEIGAVWYCQADFTRYDLAGKVVERYTERFPGRGMQFQAREVERLIEAGATSGEIMPITESVEIREVLDALRAQVGLRYPTDGGFAEGLGTCTRGRGLGRGSNRAHTCLPSSTNPQALRLEARRRPLRERPTEPRAPE
jgi:predicted dehydrogenase